MLHAQVNTHLSMDEMQVVYEYSCAKCGEFIEAGDAGLMNYLIANRERLHCGKCEPLPDVVPPILDQDFIGIRNYQFDTAKSRRLGFPACLVYHIFSYEIETQ